MHERLEALVSGRVQLVMYRDFTARAARGLGLVGEVKNLPDGSVRVVAEGTHEQIEKLIEKLKKGSLLARVEKVSVSWKPPTGEFKKFEIAYD